ncbi:MAG: hypothetical protein ACYSUI_18605, partial [Planctomycetota bacterium]
LNHADGESELEEERGELVVLKDACEIILAMMNWLLVTCPRCGSRRGVRTQCRRIACVAPSPMTGARPKVRTPPPCAR